ncbi:MAG TPA: cyclopropane-fatty-acyl-phospholipid synthase family protein [Vicinamibacterales bacterium]|nr:cyclopropane-fatty-acyl-phospholipid synthase family protein [Vicinamibacterales bacterium]
MLRRVQASVSKARIQFQLWDGFELNPTAGYPIGRLRFLNRSALYRLLWDPELNFGEAYMAGTLAIDGDLAEVLEEIYRTFGDPRRTWRHPYRRHDPRAARANVHSHYDLGNPFYALWLDEALVYTCAYYATPESTLEQAQRAKLDRVCRKLRLAPGERVIEAGCGWGALALFMARHHGVRVRAFNISKEQLAFARERAERERLGDRVEFIEDDYRNISGTCDAFVSVGMLEHVGADQYDVFGTLIGRLLTPNGRGLLHFIGRDRSAPLNAWIRRRIFPGAYAPTLGEVCDRILQPHALSVLDVENLREHYARTLDHWRSRFDAAEPTVASMFDERFVRAWRLYLAGSQAAFASGWMQLFQIVFARSGSVNVPWTRATS